MEKPQQNNTSQQDGRPVYDINKGGHYGMQLNNRYTQCIEKKYIYCFVYCTNFLSLQEQVHRYGTI